MRLLNSQTLQLEEFFHDPRDLPKYAILSHTWGFEEVSFSDMQSGSARNKRGFLKIKYVCQQAQRDGYSYAWVDTCCIDKSSSSELSEAINSMFKWYQGSEVCYVYLEGITPVDMPRSQKLPDNEFLMEKEDIICDSEFARHRWWKRGWTLQELIAPPHVKFYGKRWVYLGSSAELVAVIVSITAIDDKVLRSDPSEKMEHLLSASVAQRMSWAASRSTTKPEDQAYSLLGLFGVNMPILYGEGHAAFIRLQEEIIKVSNDQSILAWHASEGLDDESLLLAPRITCFKNCGTLRSWSQEMAPESFSLANAGLTIKLPFIHTESIAVLACRYIDEPGGFVGLPLQSINSDDTPTYSLQYPHRYDLRNHTARTVMPDSADVTVAFESKKTIMILRQRHKRTKIDLIEADKAIMFSIDKGFGESPHFTKLQLQLGFIIKSLYPPRFWKKTSLERRDMLLLPNHINVGAIRLSYRDAPFIVTFGLEKRNWNREAPAAWVSIQEATGGQSAHEAALKKEDIYPAERWATKRLGSSKAVFKPKQFPDDALEITIEKESMFGEISFKIHGRAKKITLPGLDRKSEESWIYSVQKPYYSVKDERRQYITWYR